LFDRPWTRCTATRRSAGLRSANKEGDKSGLVV
jgi:hypothetical protein